MMRKGQAPGRWVRLSASALCATLLWSAATSAFAAAVLASSEEGHVHEGHAHRHHVALFLGGAIRDEDHETESGFALGADYEYRLHPLIGAGVLVEVATGNLREVLVLAPVALHPWRDLRLVVAPGVEIPEEGDAEFALRLGIGYTVPIGSGRFSITPEFNADLIDGAPTYVAGVSLGVGF
jgi:hypothetical protein